MGTRGRNREANVRRMALGGWGWGTQKGGRQEVGGGGGGGGEALKVSGGSREQDPTWITAVAL